MYAGVGIEPQWLSAAAAGSARIMHGRYQAFSSSSSSSCFRSWACRRRDAVKIVKRCLLKNASEECRRGVGKSILNVDGVRILKEAVLCSQHGRYCGERFPARAAYGGLLRPLSSLSVRVPRASECVILPLTDDIDSEERVATALEDFILDGSRTTSIAHKVWQGVVRPGDTVIDATCGNGHDTLMLAKLVLQEGTAGYVIGLDVQQSALDNTSALLERELNCSQMDKVSLLQLCHSQLDKLVDESSVRLVAFNLGYQPGGDKNIITRADTTVKAVGAAVNVLEPGGLISVMSYVGHPGGREEYDALREFVARLPPKDWVCSHLEWLNTPLRPHLIFLLRK